MFGARWRLFRLLGIPIYLDISWVIILVLIAGSLIGQFKDAVPGLRLPEYVVMGVVTALAYFACIVLHELGHATVARATGLPIRGITLFIFGGVAELTEEPKSAGGEFLMAIAGPAVSLVLGGLFLALYAVGTALDWPAAPVYAFWLLGEINLVLLAFNMVPGFPLDGGRVFRSILWGATGNLRKATRWASFVGRGFAWVLIALGAYFFLNGQWVAGIFQVLIGMFLNNAAKGSYRQVLIREALEGERVRRFMNPQPVVVPPETTLRQFVEDYVYHHHRKAFPVGAGGRLEGYVSTGTLSRYPREEWDQHTVGDVMERDLGPLSIGPDDDALKALGQMQRTGLSRLLVVDNGNLAGIVSLKDLLRFLQLKLELEEQGGDDAPPRPPLRDARRDTETPAHNP